MLTHKLRRFGAMAVTLVFVLALLADPLGFSARKRVAAKEAREPKAAQDITALRKTRVDLARKGYEVAVPSLQQTRRIQNHLVLDGTPEDVYRWSVRWLQAQREMSRKDTDVADALEAHLGRMKKLEQQANTMISHELFPEHMRLDVAWYRLEAQLWLAEEQAR